MQVEIITDLAAEPITVAEARAYLRITTTVEDSLISSLVTAARMRLEKFSNLSFGAKEIKVFYDSVNGWRELPYQPKATISEMVDSNDNELDYEVKGIPYTSFQTFSDNGVYVTYDVEGIMNDSIKEAIKKEVATAYENRENYTFTPTYPCSNQAKMLVQPFSRNTFLGVW